MCTMAFLKRASAEFLGRERTPRWCISGRLRKKSPITSKFSYSRYAILRRRPAWHAGLHDLAVGGAPLPAALRRREEVRREEEHIP